jgi:hypothetical protein
MTAATPSGHASAPIPRRAGLVVVAVLLAIQVLVAVVMALGPRPSPYGWQMYSATPFKPEAWAVHGERVEALDVDDLLVHARAEIDYVALLRTDGCEFAGADAIRIELADETIDEVACR